MKHYALIPKSAQKLMEQQDKEREERRRKAPMTRQDRAQTFRSEFARSIHAELEMVLKHGACADVIDTPEGPIVTKRIRDKYPVRYQSTRFSLWCQRIWKWGKRLLKRFSR